MKAVIIATLAFLATVAYLVLRWVLNSIKEQKRIEKQFRDNAEKFNGDEYLWFDIPPTDEIQIISIKIGVREYTPDQFNGDKIP